MERKRRFILISGVVGVLMAIIVFALLSRPPGGTIQVTGNLSQKDVAQIQAAMNRFRRSQIAWRDVRHLPAAIKNYYGHRIGSIHGNNLGNRASVFLIATNPDPKNTPEVMQPEWSGILNSYSAVKKSNEWTIQVQPLIIRY